MITVTRGSNADLIANVARLYLPEGALVADVTYGKGVFWRKCQERRATILASDVKPIVLSRDQQDWLLPMRTVALAADFRELPYANGVFDIVVLDPPYIHNPGKHLSDARYNNAATSKGMCHYDIAIKLYLRGMEEAARTLKPGGQLWVKCKDEIESSEQRWSHREMYNLTRSLGYFQPKDYAILHATPPNGKRWDKQFHLRKNHSVLWIFERTKDVAETRLILRQHGGYRTDHKTKGKTGQPDNIIRLTPNYGTSRTYLLSRLERDHPGIFMRFHDGDFRSVRAAALAAGIVRAPRKRTVPQQKEARDA